MSQRYDPPIIPDKYVPDNQEQGWIINQKTCREAEELPGVLRFLIIPDDQSAVYRQLRLDLKKHDCLEQGMKELNYEQRVEYASQEKSAHPTRNPKKGGALQLRKETGL